MILLEVIAEDLMGTYRGGKKLTRKESKPKYTKLGNGIETLKGWNRTGVQRFNKLVIIVKASRLCSESEEMKVKLKLIYAKLSGKLYRN